RGTNMKNSTKIAVIGALLAVGVAQTNAATAVAKTNYDAAVAFKLTSYTTGSTKASTAGIATKDVINNLSLTAWTVTTTVYSATNTTTNTVVMFTNALP